MLQAETMPVAFFVHWEGVMGAPMERDIHPYNIDVKIVVSILEKADLVERKYTNQNQPIHFSPTEQKNNENKK